jgi:hypothetical protein
MFLDDALERRIQIESVRHGFGAELADALTARRRWLLSQELGREGEEGFEVDRGRLRAIAREAMNGLASKLSKDLGKEFVAPSEGSSVAGVYVRPLDLPAGRFAVIEGVRTFTLAPWRAPLETRRGLEISGVMRAAGIDLDFGRDRGLSR